MIAGILISHGQLAFEIVNAAQKIIGVSDGLYPFSNDYLSPQMLYDQIQQIIEKQTYTGFILMVDMRGGSCWTVAKMLTKEYPSLSVISGLNIPMLISFLSKREKVSLQELPAVLEEDGLRGIRID